MSSAFSSLPWHFGQRSCGASSSVVRANQAFEPSARNRAATRSATSASNTASSQASQRKAGMGTPHTRCRDRHQSGRAAIMPWMRS